MIVIAVVSCKLFVVSDDKKYHVAEKDCKGSAYIWNKQNFLLSFVVLKRVFLSTNERLMQGGGNFCQQKDCFDNKMSAKQLKRTGRLEIQTTSKANAFFVFTFEVV